MITEIVSPDFLLDDERPISSSDTLDNCSSSLGEERTPSPIDANFNAIVPSFQHTDCDSSCHRDSIDRKEAGDLQGHIEGHGSPRGQMKSPITWKKCLEQAPYADEESFSIAEVDDVENSDKQVTFIYHM